MLKLDKDYLHFYTKVSGTSLPPSAVTVYRALLQYANRKTWSCFPSVRTLANDTNLSERTIRRQISLLAKEGYILVIPRKRDNKGCTSNMYFFN